MPSLTRGPLPSSVYWRRRLVIITVALLLVFVIAKLLGGGGGGGPRNSAAQLSDQASSASASATPTTPPTSTAPPLPSGTPSVSLGPSAPPTPIESDGDSSSTSALPEPQGDCSASDVAVTPVVDEPAYAYDSVTISLRLRSLTSVACTWHVSSDALQVRLNRRSGLVWSTIDCQGAIPAQDVVVRRDTVTVLPVTWAGHRVVADACSAHAPWARPGRYTLVASSLGGEPAESRFTLLAPGATPPSSTDDPSGTSSPSGSTSPSDSTSPSATDTSSATADPDESPSATSPAHHKH